MVLEREGLHLERRRQEASSKVVQRQHRVLLSWVRDDAGRQTSSAIIPHGRASRTLGKNPVGRIRARCLTARLPNPPVRTVLAAFIAHGSREKDIYRKCPFRQLHGVHRGQLARSLTTFVPFSLPSPSGPSPCI